MSAHTFTCGFEHYRMDVEVEVTFHFSPGRLGRWYMPNGDPGYPDEPAEIEIEKVLLHGCDISGELSDRQFDILLEQCEDHMCEVHAAQDAAEYDYWHNQRKE